ncbi:MAG TPA: hypothetical protein PLD25_09405 [Chloroflexota bacterium]|nr:hypothetical protein [Chloroflexota bacterium]HUM68767.1 hypothetical protein [Chloroflexota bacterium]
MQESALSEPSTATAVSHPCIRAALSAYESARLDGLCHEGAWECALAIINACHSEAAGDHEGLLPELMGLVQL